LEAGFDLSSKSVSFPSVSTNRTVQPLPGCSLCLSTVIWTLRRHRRRWKVERLFAWMHNFRQLVTRWEYHIENFLGFVHLACLIMLRRIA
jgi:transposase